MFICLSLNFPAAAAANLFERLVVGQICIFLTTLVQPELAEHCQFNLAERLVGAILFNLVLPDCRAHSPKYNWSSGRKFQSQASMRQIRLWRNLCQGP
ncbi:hypothetical protein [Mesorhizobium sp. M1E.F.Ca.ET.063.01.1.1]|uniref:hypothetical protein n=1 Tax=Mesorhizobium sp. M1E.F.Ca.ET.063.01.1.1 TaxID=2496750 RepID=UPI001AEC83FE|nr:hypothetical protein [Mesorhizobium sp. M1E.F.Ca.ET.063.01.1.1]